MSFTTNGIALCAALVVGGPAFAHHSAAMYDNSKPTTVKAVVKSLNWTNPHVSLVVITEGTGQPLTIEMSSPGVVTRSGFSKRSFNPGDRIQLTYAPLREGGPTGLFISALAPDGKTLKWDFSPSGKANLR